MPSVLHLIHHLSTEKLDSLIKFIFTPTCEGDTHELMVLSEAVGLLRLQREKITCLKISSLQWVEEIAAQYDVLQCHWDGPQTVLKVLQDIKSPMRLVISAPKNIALPTHLAQQAMHLAPLEDVRWPAIYSALGGQPKRVVRWINNQANACPPQITQALDAVMVQALDLGQIELANTRLAVLSQQGMSAAVACYWRARISNLNGKHERAIKLYQKSTSLNSSYVPAVISQAMTLHGLGRHGEAGDICRSFLTHFSNADVSACLVEIDAGAK